MGCCLAGRTETLRRLGPFDERIFLYAEDLELGLRARDAGVETWWWPHARVIHREAHSCAGAAFGGEPFDLLARQRHAVVAERRGERAARWDDRLQAATLVEPDRAQGAARTPERPRAPPAGGGAGARGASLKRSAGKWPPGGRSVPGRAPCAAASVRQHATISSINAATLTQWAQIRSRLYSKL